MAQEAKNAEEVKEAEDSGESTSSALSNSFTSSTSSASSTSPFLTHSPEETIELGRRLSHELWPPVVVLLIGDLGAGKTTLAKGIVAGLGAAAEEDVTSPTFTLVHEYGGENRRDNAAPLVYHVDLYRIESARELATLGLEDMVSDPRSIVIIEWGEKLGDSFRNPWPGSRVVQIGMEVVSDTSRRIKVE